MAISKEDILEGIGGMSVLDLSELIKEMEEKFGVSAAAVAASGSSPLRPKQRCSHPRAQLQQLYHLSTGGWCAGAGRSQPAA